MTLSEHLDVLKSMNFRPRRKFGQNFLIDPNTLRYIAQEVPPDSADIVVEIGAGTGFLTDFLVDRCRRLVAVEHDERLAAYLEEKYRYRSNFQILHADACRLDYHEMVGDCSYMVVGNLPYSASTPIIVHILDQTTRPTLLFVLLQREMADRLHASPKTAAYNAVSVRIQSLYRIELLRKVSPKVFLPAPKVMSVLVKMSLMDNRPKGISFADFSLVVRRSFAYRRKKLINSLSSHYHPLVVQSAFDQLDVNVNARPGELAVDQYVALSRLLMSYQDDGGHT